MATTDKVAAVRYPINISAYEFLFLIISAYLYSKYLADIRSNAYVLYSSWLHFATISLAFVVFSQTLYARKFEKNYLGIGFLIAALIFSVWLYLDTTLFSLMGLHINNYVIESMMHENALQHIGITQKMIFLGSWPVVLFALPTLIAPHLTRYRFRLSVAGKGIILIISVLLAAQAVDKLLYAFFFFKAEPFVFKIKDSIPGYISLHPYHSNKLMSLVLGEEEKVDFSQQLDPQNRSSRSAFEYDTGPFHSTVVNGTYNIVFVVAESLRAQDIDETTAPFMSALKKKAISANSHYSNGNTTHFGVFALFYGLSPAYFNDARQENLPSQFFEILNRSGYSFHAALSNSMDWYDIEKFALDKYFEKHMAPDAPVSDKDKFTTKKTIELLANARSGRTFVLSYFYATHANYNHPKETTPFTPELAESIDYTDSELRENRELLLNRYRNSIYFFDKQVEAMVTQLKLNGQWDNTIFLITGDHGEEFFEHNRFGHNSQLNNFQTQVPLILHIPGRPATAITKPTSHLDIPITLFEALQPSAPIDGLFQGNSLFSGAMEPVYVGNAHYQRPQKYAVVSAERKVIVDIEGGYPVVEKVTDLNDREVGYSEDEVSPLVIGLMKHITQYRRAN